MAIQITRAHIDKAFTAALLVNSVTAAFGVLMFFLSAWWVFLILGTIGLPLIIVGFLLFRYTKYREPMKKYAINFVVKVYEGIVQRRQFLIRRIYNALCWFVPANQWKHITWGYASLSPKGDMNLKVESEDEEKLFYQQLYHYLATGMGNWNTLEGKNVLEVRCGGGGGLNYLTKYLNPNKAIGVDISSTQTDYCEKTYGTNPKMKFIPVESLEELSKSEGLSNERIDLVISLQSSKFVSDFKKFSQEIGETVRPGGIFSFADLRLAEDWAQLEKDLETSSMKILKKENISKNVIQALKLDELSKWQLINRRFGSMLKSLMYRIGVVKDNALAQSLKSGSSQAWAYLLHRLPERNIEVNS